MFIYCTVGEMVSTEAEKVCVAVYNETNWYRYPPHIRRYLIMIIQQMQQPLYLFGLGLNAWECSLENFTNVNYNGRSSYQWSRMTFFFSSETSS